MRLIYVQCKLHVNGRAMQANEVVMEMFPGELKLHNAFVFASHIQLNTIFHILIVLMFSPVYKYQTSLNWTGLNRAYTHTRLTRVKIFIAHYYARNYKMAQTTEWLPAILDYTRNVKSSISTFPNLPGPVEILNFSWEIIPYGIGMKRRQIIVIVDASYFTTGRFTQINVRYIACLIQGPLDHYKKGQS